MNHLKNMKLSIKSASSLYEQPIFTQDVMEQAEWVSFRLASKQFPRNLRGSSAAPTQNLPGNRISQQPRTTIPTIM